MLSFYIFVFDTLELLVFISKVRWKHYDIITKRNLLIVMAHFMIPSFIDCFKYRNRTHVRQNVIYSLLQMPSCVVFLASAFIFLNQYNRVHEVLCVLYAQHLLRFPQLSTLCVQSKMIKLSIFIYFFPFSSEVQPSDDGTVSCFVSSFWVWRVCGWRGVWVEEKICKMYTSMYIAKRNLAVFFARWFIRKKLLDL